MRIKDWVRAATCALFTTLTVAVPAAFAVPPTAAEYAKLPTISSVNISPDGKRLVAIASPDGKSTSINVWNLDKPEAPPTRVGAPNDAFFGDVNFIKNDRLLVTIVQRFHEQGVQTYFARAFFADLDGGNILTTAGGKDRAVRYTPPVIDRLPKDPRRVLVNEGGAVTKVDVYTGAREAVLVDSARFAGEQVDLTGDVRARLESGVQDGGAYIAQWIRHPDTRKWEEHFRWFAKNREPMQIVGFTNDPNVAFVRTSRGREKAAIFEYDIRNRKLLEPAFAHTQFDADDVLNSRAPADYGEVLGFSYEGPARSVYWLDPTLKAAEEQASKILKARTRTVDWVDTGSGQKAKVSFPDGAAVNVVDWSDDRARLLVVRSGPSQPPEYYIISEGKMRLLAKGQPWIDPASLGETRLVQYAARDGLQIPAFLTTPPRSVYGPGPYPTIIHPHGGPWARDTLDWDDSGWVQYFAARGYAVMQPQFRGSEGWGQKLWRAGDAEWGGKMQDDKDDAARWLIDQKIAAPDRIAIHGFSYGGYAAMVAAVRPNGLYQCAISGAGVGNLATIKRGVFGDRFLREFQAPTIAGLDPMENVAKVSIPILLYHGDHDLTVPIRHSEELAGALQRHGKAVTLVRLPGLAHTAGHTPELKARLLSTLEDYLKTKCGPGGL